MHRPALHLLEQQGQGPAGHPLAPGRPVHPVRDFEVAVLVEGGHVPHHWPSRVMARIVTPGAARTRAMWASKCAR